MAGLTSTGFDRKTFEQILAAMQKVTSDNISPNLQYGATSSIGQILNSVAAEVAAIWEGLEEADAGMDPDRATEDQFEQICLLTGVRRRGETAGLVTATVDLDAATYAAGTLIANVTDDPENTWTNREEIVAPGGATPAIFESINTGSGAVAAAGTLIIISSPVSGWNSITNAADATKGKDIELIGELGVRREDSLAAAGSGTLAATVADVGALEGMIDVRGDENTSDRIALGRPPHSIEITVWSGDPAAVADNDIAQAILDSKGGSARAFGADSGTAIDGEGDLQTVEFTKATEVEIFVSVTIISTTGVKIADVQAAILAEFSEGGREIGDDVIYNRMSGSVFIDGVDNYSSFTMGTAPAPAGTSDIGIAGAETATLDVVNIVVTGDVS